MRSPSARSSAGGSIPAARGSGKSTQTTRARLTRTAPDGDGIERANRCKICCILATLALLLTATAAEAHTLTYRQARPVAQKTADAFAGQRTEIKSLLRTVPLRHAYSARATWTRVDPDGCVGCGFDPATGLQYDTPSRESCSVTVIVRYRTHRSRVPTAFVDEFFCG